MIGITEQIFTNVAVVALISVRLTHCFMIFFSQTARMGVRQRQLPCHGTIHILLRRHSGRLHLRLDS